MYKKQKLRSTTVLGLIHNGEAVIGGDGQVTLGNTVVKQNAMKIRKLFKGQVLCGFAGSAADAITLMERFEEKLEHYSGNVNRSAVELAKDWRMDKYLRRLEAMLAVISKDQALIISGSGDVIEPADKIVAIGSGSMYALAAAKMLVKHSSLKANEIVEESLKTAGDICIYTNQNITTEKVSD